MSVAHLRTSLARRAGEEGVALITVVGLSFALLLVITAAAAYATNTLPQTRTHEDWNAALAAAEAGVDDALYRLNQNASYWADPDPDNDALTGWRELPGGSERAEYHYQLDASQVTRTGAVDVTSTGRVGDVTRTVEVRLRRSGFLDYIYFTDFEASDPFALVTNAAQRTYLDGYCATYHPDRDTSAVSNTTGAGGCSDIRFAVDDVIDGPLRSNDALLIRVDSGNPLFLGPVLTGWTGDGTRLYLRDTGSVGEPFFQDGIANIDRMIFPATSASIAQHAEDTGCRYQGPTYIRFEATATPRMVVVSPRTPRNSVPVRCGGGTGTAGVSARVNLPSGEAIYVGQTTSGGTTHALGLPHASDNVSPAYSRTAGDVFVHGRLDGQVTIAADNSIYVVHDLTYLDDGPDSDDLLGLIADENIWVYHPVQRTGAGTGSNPYVYTNIGGFRWNQPPFSAVPSGLRDSSLPDNNTPWRSPEIHGALLALNRSFGVQNFSRGAPYSGSGENLTVYGAIAQRWRGPVATGNSVTGVLASGYRKDYAYDWRLQFLTPPYFLEPERAPWLRRQWAEVVPSPSECAEGVAVGTDGCLPPRD